MDAEITTKRFVLRAMRQTDPTAPFRKWASDPEIMHPLNLPARQLSDEEVRRYIDGFDNVNRYLLGAFDTNGAFPQLGFWIVEINRVHRTANWHVVIGERAYWGRAAAIEMAVALVDWLLNQRGVEKVTASVASANARVLRLYHKAGWRIEGVLRGELASVSGSGRIDEVRFGLLKEEWPAMRDHVLAPLRRRAARLQSRG